MPLPNTTNPFTVIQVRQVRSLSRSMPFGYFDKLSPESYLNTINKPEQWVPFFGKRPMPVLLRRRRKRTMNTSTINFTFSHHFFYILNINTFSESYRHQKWHEINHMNITQQATQIYMHTWDENTIQVTKTPMRHQYKVIPQVIGMEHFDNTLWGP